MSLKADLFFKYSGAGNTFILVDGRSNSEFNKQFLSANRLELSVFAKSICSHHEGFGADGFLVLRDGNDQCDFIWNFFNSDGSDAEMCGNAARCAGAFARDWLSMTHKDEVVFLTGAGLVATTYLADRNLVRVQMPMIHELPASHTILIQDKKIEGYSVNTGVPHFVFNIPNEHEYGSYLDICRSIRSHEFFGAKGTNVTLIRSTGDNKNIDAVTFERGVEGFTLACGTGAVAAASVFVQLHPSANRDVNVCMPGGMLNVDLKKSSMPNLTGQAILIGKMNYLKTI